MATSEVLNPVFEILIGEEPITVKQLSISSIFSIVEKRVKEEKLADAKMVADMMNPQERGAFLLKVWNDLPKGSDLAGLTMEFLQSIPGIVSILTEAVLAYNKKLLRPEVTEKINNAITLSNIDEYVKMAFRVLGVEQNVKEETTPKKK